MIFFVSAVLFFCLFAAAYADDAGDRPVSESFLYEVFAPKLISDLNGTAESGLKEVIDVYTDRVENIYFDEESDYIESETFKLLHLTYGNLLELAPYTMVRMKDGMVGAVSVDGDLLQLNSGSLCGDMEILRSGQSCFTAEQCSAKLRVYSDSAELLVKGAYYLREESDIPVEERFTDIPRDIWFASYVWQLAGKGIVSGVARNSFSPSVPVTRAAFVTILGRMHGAESASSLKESFSDVPETEWYALYVSWAADAGIVNGYEDGSFKPNDAISREQMAVILYRYLKHYGYLNETAETEAFADAETVSDYAQEAVTAIKAAGIMNGKENNCFDSKGTATRAEACTVVCRLSEILK